MSAPTPLSFRPSKSSPYFEIPVGDSMLVQVVHCQQNLLHDASGVGFGVLAARDNVVKEFSARDPVPSERKRKASSKTPLRREEPTTPSANKSSLQSEKHRASK